MEKTTQPEVKQIPLTWALQRPIQLALLCKNDYRYKHETKNNYYTILPDFLLPGKGTKFQYRDI